MSRSRLFAVFSALALLALWTSCASGPRAEPGVPRPKRPLDVAFDWQSRVLSDTMALPGFEVDGKKIQAIGVPCVVAVPKAGEDPAELLKTAAAIAAGEREFKAYWAAPDAATDDAARKAGVAGTAGSLAPQVGAAIPVDVRPALLFVAHDGSVRFAHFPGSAWDPELFMYEARELAYEAEKANGGFRINVKRLEPPPSKEYKGALYCGACHRGFFRDWLMTPHSIALDDLGKLGRDGEAECIGCHVVGWEKGGFSDRDKHRQLADVQCEACHQPERTHSPTHPMSLKNDDYTQVCAKCHTQKFSFFQDPNFAMHYVSHPQRNAAFSDKANFDARPAAIGSIKDQMYKDVCGITDFVGTSKCQECHQQAHEQWSGTPHGKAFAALESKGKTEDPKCLPCHTTGYGQKLGFHNVKDTPDFKNVGCESCHGPGLKHIQAKTDAERSETIFAFDKKCPTCVITRICQSCHEEHKRPCFTPGETPFDLNDFLQKVRHRPQ
jgi:predicted CXXCH cytochrome family protein